MEFTKRRVYHLYQNHNAGNGGAGGGVLLSGDFGDWLPLPQKNANIYDEQLEIKYKLDLLSYPNKAILYLVGQFGLKSTFIGANITLGVLPLNTRPKHQLKKYFITQNIECYLVIELNGEVKFEALTGDLPVCNTLTEPDPYHINLDYQPEIAFDAGSFTAVRTQNFTRNNCGNGNVGSTVQFSKTYTSNISQADANNQRSNDANFVADGQAWANDPANGATCSVQTVFYKTRTENFQRNNCAEGYTGSIVAFSKVYSSTVSQADADNQAATDPNFASLGQIYANDSLNGAICSLPAAQFYAERTANFTRNNCGDGSLGSTVPFTKHYSSSVSQIDANNKAANDANFVANGQAFANDPANGATCSVVVEFAVTQDGRRMKIGGAASIACDLQLQFTYNLNVYETVTVPGVPTFVETTGPYEATIDLAAGSLSAYTDHNLSAGPGDKIEILDYDWTPKTCAGKIVDVTYTYNPIV